MEDADKILNDYYADLNRHGSDRMDEFYSSYSGNKHLFGRHKTNQISGKDESDAEEEEDSHLLNCILGKPPTDMDTSDDEQEDDVNERPLTYEQTMTALMKDILQTEFFDKKRYIYI